MGGRTFDFSAVPGIGIAHHAFMNAALEQSTAAMFMQANSILGFNKYAIDGVPLFNDIILSEGSLTALHQGGHVPLLEWPALRL